MRARTRTALIALAGAAACAWPGGVRAYSDPATFAAPVLEAGGGGRFYTGSPAEGYGCESCHTGGDAPEVKLEGLPDRYVRRATYELRVSWSRRIEHASAALELTDERGDGAGTIALPAEGTYVDAEQCEPLDVGLLATQLYPGDRGRTIAATPDCGASALRVQWTAPSKDVGPVWLSGSVLASDHDGDFTGDGVRNFTRAIPPFGGSVPEVVTHGDCTVGRAFASSSSTLWLWFVALFVALERCRRRAQRALLKVSEAKTKRWSS